MEDLRQAAADRRRKVVFSELFDPFRLLIDGRTFDHDRVDQRVNLGATEEWRLVNTSPDTHPFHIHVNDFQVLEINGEPVDAWSWEDTASIPAFGEMVIRTRFLDFPGKFVYHCRRQAPPTPLGPCHSWRRADRSQSEPLACQAGASRLLARSTL